MVGTPFIVAKNSKVKVSYYSNNEDLFQFISIKKSETIFLFLGAGTVTEWAKDFSRDQSYFLFSTTQKQLDFLRFPLGDIEKTETRNIAKKLNLNVSEKPDSQDICFVPNGDYSTIIKKFRPESFKPGNIIDIRGNVIGEHDGCLLYTSAAADE